MLLTAAGDLLLKSQKWSGNIATANDLNALRERCAELAKDQQAYAELVKQLTEQLSAVSAATQATAARARRSSIIAVVAIVIGVAACVLNVVR